MPGMHIAFGRSFSLLNSSFYYRYNVSGDQIEGQQKLGDHDSYLSLDGLHPPPEVPGGSDEAIRSYHSPSH